MNPLDTINNRRAQILLIYPQNVLDITTISTNIQETNLIPHIQLMQDKIVRKILGRTLYKELFDAWIAANQIEADIDDGSISGGTNYKELYAMVKPALIWWTYTDFITANHYRVEEKGVVIKYSDYANPAQDDAVHKIESRVRKHAEFYVEELVEYIHDVFEKDQTFQEETENEGRYFSGIYLPYSKKCINNKL